MPFTFDTHTRNRVVDVLGRVHRWELRLEAALDELETIIEEALSAPAAEAAPTPPERPAERQASVQRLRAGVFRVLRAEKRRFEV